MKKFTKIAASAAAAVLLTATAVPVVPTYAETYQVEYEFHYRGRCFPVYNDPAMVPKVRESVRDIFDKGFFARKHPLCQSSFLPNLILKNR